MGKVCSRFWAVCAGPSAIWNQVRWQHLSGLRNATFAEKQCAARCDRVGSERDVEAWDCRESYLLCWIKVHPQDRWQ